MSKYETPKIVVKDSDGKELAIERVITQEDEEGIYLIEITVAGPSSK